MPPDRENVPPAGYSIVEAGRQLGGFSRAHIYNLARAGKLRILKIGRRSVVPSADIARLLDEADELYPPAS